MDGALFEKQRLRINKESKAGAGPENILNQKFYTTIFWQHSDWLKKRLTKCPMNLIEITKLMKINNNLSF